MSESFCEKCGSRLIGDERFCAVCDTPVEVSPDEGTETRQAKSPSGSGENGVPTGLARWLVGIILLGAVGVAAGYYFWPLTQEQSTVEERQAQSVDRKQATSAQSVTTKSTNTTPAPNAAQPEPAKPKEPKKEVASAEPDRITHAQPDRWMTLVSDKASYHIDDLAVFTVRTTDDCNLTLINVSASDRETVIFPNSFQPDNFINGGEDIALPGPDALYQFRLRDRGQEKLVAECTVGGNHNGTKDNFEDKSSANLGEFGDPAGIQAEKKGETQIGSGSKKTSASPRKSRAGAKETTLLRAEISFWVQ